MEKLVTQGIISSMNNNQIVEKPNGSLRICLNPKPLNECIKRKHFLIRRSNDIIGRSSDKRVFKDEVCSELTTFITPFGRYSWISMPFGINNALEPFQKLMIFGDIPGAEVYFDDVAIAERDYSDHDKVCDTVHERKN